jgi:hypothetical protein
VGKYRRYRQLHLPNTTVVVVTVVAATVMVRVNMLILEPRVLDHGNLVGLGRVA